MKHLIMHKPQCLLYSAAMVLDTSVEALVSFIGHDGMSYIDGRLRGVHIQEIQIAAIQLGYILYSIELMPVSNLDGYLFTLELNNGRTPYEIFYSTVNGRHAILIGETKKGKQHAVAYDGNIILDPANNIHHIADFNIREAWIPMRCC